MWLCLVYTMWLWLEDNWGSCYLESMPTELYTHILGMKQFNIKLLIWSTYYFVKALTFYGTPAHT